MVHNLKLSEVSQADTVDFILGEVMDDLLDGTMTSKDIIVMILENLLSADEIPAAARSEG